MLVLGIESTCDETACSLVEDGDKILSNIVSSQIDLHREYGGVVPELACRRHVDILIPVIDQALNEANKTLKEIDLIAVAHGPGLIGALLIGVNAAKALSLVLNKPFIGINHIEAHLYAAIMSSQEQVSFPCLGVVLSGGHTALVLMKGLGDYQLLGQTVDDAIGEAFDKVAKMLQLPYPGGPHIERLAAKGSPYSYAYRAGRIKGNPLDFSFSGLKTSVLYSINNRTLSDLEKQHIAASFQEAALNDIVAKATQAAASHGCRSLVFGGGVTNNQRLRQLFCEQNYICLWPSTGLSLDNAAMIAGLGYHQYLRFGKGDSLHLAAQTRISLATI